MELLFVFTVVLFFVVLASFVRHYKIGKKYPPGPLGLPFIGLLPFQIVTTLFSKYLPKSSEMKFFKQMSQKYGPIWSMAFGNQRIVTFASFDLINEAFVDNGKLFSGRPILESLKIMTENEGFAFVSGEPWYNNRQLIFKALRDLGIGTRQMENQICTEVEELIDYIDNNISKPFDNPHLFTKPIANVIGQILFNERNRYDDPQLERYMTSLNYVFHSNEAQNKIELFSKVLPVKYIKNLFADVQKFMDSNAECMKFITGKCRSRKKIEGEYSKPSCVFDFFWRYQYQDMEFEEKLWKTSHIMFDLFLAGADTSTNILGFSFLILGKYQNLQKELRREIQLLTDNYRLINIDMRKDCPKLLSFIDEVQRYCCTVQKIFRRTLETCKFKGYIIDSTDLIYADIANEFRNPEIFKNPDEFDPYRFMDKSRTMYIPNKFLIPFGIGKRICIGESIANMELFLFLSKIILRFNISVTTETNDNFLEILEGEAGIIHGPLNHEISFQNFDFKDM